MLIPKSEEEAKLRYVSGYRPITLCNVDYKIFAKVLARRLQSVTTVLVGEHQTCGIKGRSIQTNVHIARSLLEHCCQVGGQMAMLQNDLEKAFDRVNYEVLFRILSCVNVGQLLLQGIRMAYTGCMTSLIINSNVTRSVIVRSSVRQGCPLSPLLFALY